MTSNSEEVIYVEIITTKGMIPQHSILAPKHVTDKILRGEALNEDDIKLCISRYWSVGE